MVLWYNTFTLLSDTGALLARQKVVPVTSWDSAYKQLEVCKLLCAVLIGDASCHMATQEIEYLVYKNEGVSI